jgi:DNA-binding CsgD family transcriptional regulator
VPGAWTLVGRDDELARVAKAVRRPDRTGVVIIGPAGVGKTRLLTECLERGRHHGFAVVRARASSVATDIPFGALAALLPAEATRGGGMDALAGARTVLRETAGERPLLLAVDDAHLLDDASALLVHQLAIDLTAFVALTVRSGEPVPDPITSLWKDDLADRIEVGTLERVDVDELLVKVLGGPVDPATETIIWQRSAGNALYLRELVVGALDAGTLTCDDGLWRLRRDASLPPRLVDVVQDRLRHLDDDTRAALSFVAFGEPVGVLLLERIVDETTLEHLERLGLIDVSLDGRRLNARLAHPLHGEILRRETPLLEARSRRRTLADLLDGVGTNRREDGFRLAVWRLEGGGEIAAERLVRAARSAREAGDVELGERLARAASDRGGGFAAEFELGLCLYRSGEHDGARAVLDQQEGNEPGDQEIAALAVARADAAFWGQGRQVEATQILERARDRLGSEARRAADVIAMQAMVEAHSGLADEAISHALPLVGGASGFATVEAIVAAGIALSAAGRSCEALELIDGLCGWPDLPLPARAAALHVRTVVLVDLGQLADAESSALESHRLALEMGDATSRGYSAAVLCWTYLAMGRLTAARQVAVESSALFRAAQQLVARRWALSMQLLSLALANAVEEAKELVSTLDGIGSHDGRLHEPIEQLGRAWLDAAEGRFAEARATLVAAADACERRGQHALAMLAVHQLGRLGAPDSEAAARLAVRCDSPFMLAMADHVAAIDRGDAAALAASAEAFAAFGADLIAAEAAAAARDEFARAGEQQIAARWARRSRELAERCEGATTPGLDIPHVAVPLTRREREIAALVAAGRTSRAVADQLHLSVRTVENHLARVYDKLGVNSRPQLAEALGR